MNTEMTLQTTNFNLSLIERFKGISSVIIAYIALRCLSLSMICKIVSILKRRCSREIGIDEANIAWGAVRQSSFFFLGRVACLELSLAFVLFALTKGLSATCCVGVANEPFRAHSWVELSGKPFRECDYVEQDFSKLLTI
ncbi:lasso peptide biosynthesis B2 protein [Nostoc sp. MG11]|uniref:lasso peptide biosynthesis B2 protein n=1 Tax=Nostoc sp. MG11 TaxID=2721166 RepID=UPI001868DD00|nr:lasso peptide biosynthesis B2 protein [Nostoc sp. MG11]